MPSPATPSRVGRALQYTLIAPSRPRASPQSPRLYQSEFKARRCHQLEQDRNLSRTVAWKWSIQIFISSTQALRLSASGLGVSRPVVASIRMTLQFAKSGATKMVVPFWTYL
ncbi:hypothetical protein AB1N83_008035 [Pleurotus pulmonarius]